MGNDWKRTGDRVRVMNFPHTPAATNVKKSRKTQTEDCGKNECQKRAEENQDSDCENQNLQLYGT